MDDSLDSTLDREFTRATRLTIGALVALVALEVVIFVVVFAVFGAQTAGQWLPELVLAVLFSLLIGAIALSAIGRARRTLARDAGQAVAQELRALRSANNRAQSLQRMASTLSATLSFERVVEQSLDACSLALDEMGIPRESLVGAVFLYEDGVLRPIARRRFLGEDSRRVIAGKRGVVGAALSQAEPAVTNNPAEDPELRDYEAFRDCLTAVCVPLRAGFQLFGAMVIGTDTPVSYTHLDVYKRQGHWRDGVRPRSPAGAARAGHGHPVDQRRPGRSAGPVRPHSGHLRGAHHGRRAPRRSDGGEVGVVDGGGGAGF